MQWRPVVFAEYVNGGPMVQYRTDQPFVPDLNGDKQHCCARQSLRIRISTTIEQKNGRFCAIRNTRFVERRVETVVGGIDAVASREQRVDELSETKSSSYVEAGYSVIFRVEGFEP